MNVQQISIDIPNDILAALKAWGNETEIELKKRIKIILAIQLYSIYLEEN